MASADAAAVETGGGGVVGEHQAVRTAAGLFDVSHLSQSAHTPAVDVCPTSAFSSPRGPSKPTAALSSVGTPASRRLDRGG